MKYLFSSLCVKYFGDVSYERFYTKMISIPQKRNDLCGFVLLCIVLCLLRAKKMKLNICCEYCLKNIHKVFFCLVKKV